MGIFSELLKRVPEERRQGLSDALRPRLPNSFDGGGPGRLRAAQRRIATRNMDELIGMCRMIMADGAVDASEATTLLRWMETNYQAVSEWPGNVLYDRITAALVDGRIDAGEEKELLDVLAKVVGGPPAAEGPRVSGAIPFDSPEPPIVFDGRSFVVTGQFVYGGRKKVEGAIEERGGELAAACSGKTHFLVVGTFGSEEWLHSTHGTKIIKAVELKKAGKPIAIVTERHWTDHL